MLQQHADQDIRCKQRQEKHNSVYPQRFKVNVTLMCDDYVS
jgi:hypothetical protein